MRPPEEVKKEIAQQAAEKYLKALLTWHQIEFPKTHAIEQLLDLWKDLEPETAPGIRDAVAPAPYGVDIRYLGGQPEPDLQETLEAEEVARKVRDAVTDRLGEIQ